MELLRLAVGADVFNLLVHPFPILDASSSMQQDTTFRNITVSAHLVVDPAICKFGVLIPSLDQRILSTPKIHL
jgi:hypothetical protein